MIDKRVTLSDAASLVSVGNTLALGGMTLYRRPLTFTRTLLRENFAARDLTLLCLLYTSPSPRD